MAPKNSTENDDDEAEPASAAEHPHDLHKPDSESVIENSSRHLVICFHQTFCSATIRPHPRLTTPQTAVSTSLAYLQHSRSPKSSISTAKISSSAKIAKLLSLSTKLQSLSPASWANTSVRSLPRTPALVRQTDTATTDGVILDAGSSGTRMHVYRWADAIASQKHASKQELSRLPRVETKKKWTKKTSPGNRQSFPRRLGRY